jgi:hypothetical protein
MRTLSPVLLWLLVAGPAGARLGETTNQIYARYGNPLGQDSYLGLPAEAFTFKEYNVVVVFKDGKSCLEALKPKQESDRIEPDVAEGLATRVGNCAKWSRQETINPPGVEFKGTNGMVAMLTRGPQPPDSLIICTSEAVERMREATRKESEAKTGAAQPVKPGDPDPSTNALRLQQQQAINGLPAAQCALGKRYLVGDGVPADLQLARYWLEKAAAKGDPEAKAALRKMDGK